MNIKLWAWTIVFILIGGGIMFYGMSYNPLGWFQGFVSFTEPNDEPIPWGLLVIGYIFFGVIGTGVSTYNSLYELFNKNHKEKNPFDKIKLRNEWLAFAVLIPGWIMVFASTYKPAEALYIYLSFRDTSRIAWNGVLYALVGIGIIAEILALIGEKIKEEGKRGYLDRFLAWLSSKTSFEIPGLLKIVVDIDALIVGYAILAELILDANLGSVFGYLSTWVYEFGPFMSILLVVASFYAGIAMISFITPLYSWLRKPSVVSPPSAQPIATHSLGSGNVEPQEDNIMFKILARDGLLATISIGFLVLWWVWLTATNQETFPWAQLLLTGSWSLYFWIGLVLIGIIIPIALYSVAYKKESKGWLFASSIFALLGWFMLITIADVIPQAISWYYSVSPITPPGSTWAYELRSNFNGVSQFTQLPFAISQYDLVWFAGSALFLLGVYTLGVLLLPLEEEEKPKHVWIFK
ncbi:NrfD/PsrC family molybdoenzyme membrane anchor subunit [Acidianus ambivalens]|uniref:Sulfur reduction protein DsrP n=1 Tax=Acidianus ambivalens TaxID=2283 RepID=A0A650CVQ9_ACIAM|nr:NrfD/PsrC family molybdoenzyme membrane anchor subunit [Acidianus ambivalens]MQL56545.1 sulfur reduction protein DsrP [Acidianus ambivalens]QGR21930.1 sulfur reduction protein DsrP [Acidianus ambivalens]